MAVIKKEKNSKTLKTIKDREKEKGEQKIQLPEETDKEKRLGWEAHALFRVWQHNRDQRFQLFGGLTLTEFIEESVFRYTTSVFERENMEDWQSRTNVPMTRNKINNISGRAIQNMPIGNIVGHGLGKHRRATILNNLYQYSEDTVKYSLTMADMITDAMVKGTAISYEGHNKTINLSREIKGGKESVTQVVKNDLITTIVQLEDFYPSTVFVNGIDELPGAAWREIMDRDSFLSKYGSFKKAKEIPGYSTVNTDQFPAYRDDASGYMGDGKVEVIHMYRKDTDEYIILANGFILNPIMLADGDVTTSPLPFKHKKLPFFSMKFEPLASNFLYGNSMPNKLRESQDMLNVMTNMVFDQSVMALFSPIITSSSDYIEDDFLRPGRRIAIDTNGQRIDDVIKELKISPPSGWYQFILGYTKGIIEDASVDALSSGSTAELADRTTAEAVRTAAAGIASTLTYFGLQIRESVKDKTKLRIGNILQIYFDKSNPIAHKVIGDRVEYVNSAFNEFSIDNAELFPNAEGKIQRGRKIIQVYKSEEDMPTGEDLRAQKKIEVATSGKNVEIVAIPSDYFDDMFEFDVKVVADKRLETTRESEQAVAMFKAQTYMQLGQGRIDTDEVLADLMEANGDDPTRLLLSYEQQNQSQMPENQQDPSKMGGAPGGAANNFGNNITQQMAGGAQRLTQ